MVGKRILVLCGALVILLAISQLTRFENVLHLTYDGKNLTGKFQNITITKEINRTEFVGISVQFQKSMVGENGLRSLVVSDGTEQKCSLSHNVFYLFGRDWRNNMVRGKYLNFKETFGDWIKDRFKSSPVNIYKDALPPEFSLNLAFTGRGYITVLLHSEKMVQFDIADGFIDNSFGMCRGCCTVVSNDRGEFISTNMKRVLNFFVEGFIIAVFLGLIIEAAAIIRRKM